MTVSDEKFFAWLDGELAPSEAALVEAEVANSPELTRVAERHRAMHAHLKAAFDRVADAPVPEGLRPTGKVMEFAAAKSARDLRRWRRPVQWAAMAATLVIGVFAGTLVGPRNGGPIEVQGGRLYAASGLGHALETELASAPGSSPVRIGFTFRDASGAVCRTFSDPQSSGLACRDGSRWQLRGLFAAPEGQASAYRMAAGMDPNLAALVNSDIAGDPFDAAQEKVAKEHHWE